MLPCLFYVVLEMQPKALNMVGKHSSTELHSQPRPLDGGVGRANVEEHGMGAATIATIERCPSNRDMFHMPLNMAEGGHEANHSGWTGIRSHHKPRGTHRPCAQLRNSSPVVWASRRPIVPVLSVSQTHYLWSPSLVHADPMLHYGLFNRPRMA